MTAVAAAVTAAAAFAVFAAIAASVYVLDAAADVEAAEEVTLTAGPAAKVTAGSPAGAGYCQHLQVVQAFGSLSIRSYVFIIFLPAVN